MGAAVFVAGLGAISAIGNNKAECLASLENGQSGIRDMTYLNSVYQKTFPVAEVKCSNEELAAKVGLPPHISRTSLLSIAAAKEAFNEVHFEDFESLRTGFVSANTVGGMDKTESFFSNPQKTKLREVVDHECGSITELVADHLGIRHYVTTISTACSSSANAIIFGARLIKNNILDVVVAGGVDALTKFTVNGFNSLMILDKEYCKPFDENRKGLNLGEGAGYIVLISEKVSRSLKTTPYCVLSGYSNANDAYHQTASSPDGIGSYLAMKGALERSGLQTTDIDYINLHGTGTQNNDLSEGSAIKRLFHPHLPKMGSTKSFTGHTLGASGGLEAVFSALAVKHGLVYPNLRFSTSMKELNLHPETRFSNNEPIRHVLSNSFGFGGNCSSLIFSKL